MLQEIGKDFVTEGAVWGECTARFLGTGVLLTWDMPDFGGTVQHPEATVEKTLANLRVLHSADPAMSYLAPAGFRPRVHFIPNSSSEPWSPEDGQILIKFERLREDPVHAPSAPPLMADPVASRSIEEILAALNEAEAIPGRTFVSIKWFRDDFLPARGFEWTKTPEERQNVLARAIGEGWMVTSKIANPMAPLYPTTTIRVNRQRQSRSTPQMSRFRPVPISGEPLSSTLLRDRGPR